MRRRELLLIVLFFGSLWGAVEAGLGELLHRADVPYASVPLTIIAFALLTIAWVYCPRAGTSTLIASCAMLFKFVNTPFWGCHLLGILLLGAAFDLLLLATAYDLRRGPGKALGNALFGAAATYLGFALFAVLITYVFRYEYWARDGLPRVVNHVFVGGTVAAIGSAIAVPLSVRFGEFLKANPSLSPLALRSRVTAGGMSLLMMVLWILAATVSV